MTTEELHAWDMYFAALISGRKMPLTPDSMKDFALNADAMLIERRKRYEE